MENLDILIFTIILVLAFIAFGIATFREFNKMGANKYDEKQPDGGAKSFLGYLGKVFTG